jgi:nucleoside-diphosphate-sugar epimerase
MKIFISGASGYLGQKLAWRLADLGEEVKVLIRNPKTAIFLNHPNISIFQGDVLEIDHIKKAIKDCEIVFHLAAMGKEWKNHPNDILKTNVEGSKNMLQAAEEQGVKKFIQTSSYDVIGPSLRIGNKESTPRWSSFNNTFEISKFLADQELSKRIDEGFPGIIIYPTRIFGPGILSQGALVNKLIIQYLRNKITFIPYNRPFINNYAFIDDVVNGLIQASSIGTIGEKYILGGENVDLKLLYKTINKFNRNSGLIWEVPISAIQAFSWTTTLALEYLKKQSVITPDLIELLKQNFVFESTKAFSELNYHITPFDLAMEKTVTTLLNKQPS